MQVEIRNLYESAYYRRLVIAYIISERGPLSAVEIVSLLNWPLNTVRTNINGIRDLGIEVEFFGSRKTGGYRIISWGPVKKSWIKQRFNEILSALDKFSAK